MKTLILFLCLICAGASAPAQITNYVKNPSFEAYSTCPDEINQIVRAKYWSCAVDTEGIPWFAPELYHSCSGVSMPVRCAVPNNTVGYQYPHLGNAYLGAHFYYDKTPPPPAGLSTNWRDYAQGHLHQPLVAGKSYCISFWLVLAETSGYAHNSIGAYLDNGDINKRSPAGDMITDVVPQYATSTIVKDTQNWVKVEGSFVATGKETHITLGNFAKQTDVDTAKEYYFRTLAQYSYYLIDDVSVVPLDLKAEAGADRWVEQSKTVAIGRVGDTTAEALDCKWYHKGKLVDSGAIIQVAAHTVKYAVDTYVVVQTVCGMQSRDTVLVRTVGLDISEMNFENAYSIYPNPSNGNILISCFVIPKESITAKVYDLLGRIVDQQTLNFNNKEATLKLNIPSGSYILELKDEAGNVQRERIVVN